MALDIFALLTSDGDHAQADHMFTGKAGDIAKTGAALCRRLCPIVGVLAAFPLAYKLMFSA